MLSRILAGPVRAEQSICQRTPAQETAKKLPSARSTTSVPLPSASYFRNAASIWYSNCQCESNLSGRGATLLLALVACMHAQSAHNGQVRGSSPQRQDDTEDGPSPLCASSPLYRPPLSLPSSVSVRRQATRAESEPLRGPKVRFRSSLSALGEGASQMCTGNSRKRYQSCTEDVPRARSSEKRTSTLFMRLRFASLCSCEVF